MKGLDNIARHKDAPCNLCCMSCSRILLTDAATPCPTKKFQIARFTVEANRCMCTHMVFCIILFSTRGSDNGARSTSWVVRLGNVVASATYTAETGWPVSVLVRATEQAISAFGKGHCRTRKCWSKDSLRGRLTKSSHVMLTNKN